MGIDLGAKLVICSNCSYSIEAGQLFCRNCGARVAQAAKATKPVLAKGLKDSLSGLQSVKGKVSATGTSLARSSSQAASRIIGKLSSIGPTTIAKVKANPIRWGVALFTTALAISYSIAFAVVLNTSGPNQVIDKYLSVSNSKDLEQLANQDLFPTGSNSTEVMPASLTSIYGSETLHAENISWGWFSDSASLRIVNAYGQQVETLELKATDHWNYGLLSKSWQVSSPAPTFRLSAVGLGTKQHANFGDLGVAGSSDRNFTQFTGKTFVGFPGLINVSADDYGFKSSSENVIEVASGPAVIIRASEGDLAFPSSLESTASTQADTAATYCATNRCSYLPYFSDSDYSWDNDPAYDTYYDYTNSSTYYSSNGCSITDSTALSASNGVATFDCDISSTRNVEHVLTFYYFPDDVTSFSGTADLTMSLTLKYYFDQASGEFKLSSITN